MPAGTLHMSTPFSFLYNLPTLLALPKFLHSLKIYRNFNLTLSFMCNLKTIQAMLPATFKTTTLLLQFIHKTIAVICLTRKKIRIIDDLIVISNFSESLTFLFWEKSIRSWFYCHFVITALLRAFRDGVFFDSKANWLCQASLAKLMSTSSKLVHLRLSKTSQTN